MNPMTNVKNVKKLSENELKNKTGNSWHNQYKDSAWIFVGGLCYDLTEGDVEAVFSQYGEPLHINLVRDRDTGKSKGFCFICYADQQSTDLAVDNLNGIKLLGRTIRVDHVENYCPPKHKKGNSLEDLNERNMRNQGDDFEEDPEDAAPKKPKKCISDSTFDSSSESETISDSSDCGSRLKKRQPSTSSNTSSYRTTSSDNDFSSSEDERCKRKYKKDKKEKKDKKVCKQKCSKEPLMSKNDIKLEEEEIGNKKREKKTVTYNKDCKKGEDEGEEEDEEDEDEEDEEENEGEDEREEEEEEEEEMTEEKSKDSSKLCKTKSKENNMDSDDDLEERNIENKTTTNYSKCKRHTKEKDSGSESEEYEENKNDYRQHSRKDVKKSPKKRKKRNYDSDGSSADDEEFINKSKRNSESRKIKRNRTIEDLKREARLIQNELKRRHTADLHAKKSRKSIDKREDNRRVESSRSKDNSKDKERNKSKEKKRDESKGRERSCSYNKKYEKNKERSRSPITNTRRSRSVDRHHENSQKKRS